MPLLMTVAELERFLSAEFPQTFHPDSGLSIEAVWEGGCRVRPIRSVGEEEPVAHVTATYSIPSAAGIIGGQI